MQVPNTSIGEGKVTSNSMDQRVIILLCCVGSGNLVCWCPCSIQCAPVNHTDEKILASSPSVQQHEQSSSPLLISLPVTKAGEGSQQVLQCQFIAVFHWVITSKSPTCRGRERERNVPAVPTSSARWLVWAAHQSHCGNPSQSCFDTYQLLPSGGRCTQLQHSGACSMVPQSKNHFPVSVSSGIGDSS